MFARDRMSRFRNTNPKETLMEKPELFYELLALCGGNITLLQRHLFIQKKILEGKVTHDFEKSCIEFPDEETYFEVMKEVEELYPIEQDPVLKNK